MELTLGFGVALTVNSLFWPYSPRQEWDERYRRAWGVCRTTCAQWFAGSQPESPFAKRPDKLDRQLEEVLGLLSDRIKPMDAADPGPAIRLAATRRPEEIIIWHCWRQNTHRNRFLHE